LGNEGVRMSYVQTEQIILEQLEAGNYSLSEKTIYWFHDLILTIPKSKKGLKIVVKFESYVFTEETSCYIPHRKTAGEVSTVTLGNWWNSQQINLSNESLKQRLAEICAEYWSGQTVKRRLAIAKDDAAWAEKFRKVF
jgi:hypothetical protein